MSKTHIDRGDGNPMCQARPKTPSLSPQSEADCQSCQHHFRIAPGPDQVLRCSICEKWKPGSEFHADNTRPTGKVGYCKPCYSEYRKRLVASKAEWTAQRHKKYQQENPHHRRRNALINRKLYPKAAYARDVIRNEIKRGRLTVGLCEQCGTDKNIDGHHDDYDCPLVVRWLCKKHHAAWHLANGHGANIEGEPVHVGSYLKRTG